MESALEEITLRELIDMVIDARLIDLHVSLPARVDSYNASSQTVDVTPMVNKMVPDGAVPPNYVSEELPKLSDVPVAQIRGNGMCIAMPLAKGDYGELVFNERNISAWRATGNQSDPGDLGLHTMSSAYFVPAVAPDSKALSNAHGTNLVIGSDTNAASRIVIKPSGEIDLGASPTSEVALATKTQNYLTALSAAINGWTPVPNDGGAALKTALSTAGIIGGTWGTDVKSSNVKAQ